MIIYHYWEIIFLIKKETRRGLYFCTDNVDLFSDLQNFGLLKKKKIKTSGFNKKKLEKKEQQQKQEEQKIREEDKLTNSIRFLNNGRIMTLIVEDVSFTGLINTSP